MKKPIIIAENIRSIYNVGALFRLADATDIEKIILVGITATPVNRFGTKNVRLQKTALGSEDTVSWKYVKTIEEALESIQKTYEIIAIEKTTGAKIYTDHTYTKPPAFIFGNEVDGVSKIGLSKSNTILDLPMLGDKESINVSSSAAVILYSYLERNKPTL